MRTYSLKHKMRTALLAAGTLMLAGVSANAQDGRDYAYSGVYGTNEENVQVAVPRYRPETDKAGIPMMHVSLSQQVSYADLNLRTYGGAEALRARVKLATRMLCRGLDERFPITASDSPPCYKSSVRDALYRADDAIAYARGYASNEY